MKKILINLIHPNLEQSRVNKFLIQKIQAEENMTINNLYSKYPDFKIDRKKEQELVLEHDVIVFQFPMHWFGAPTLLKEWFTSVFERNFAFGENYKFEGKQFTIAVSTGSAKEVYSPTGNNKYTVEEYLRPFEGTANFVKMQYEAPFITNNSFAISDEELENTTINYLKHIKSLKK